MARVHVTATLNGNDVEFLCETRQTLLQILRDELHLTGTKEGCATGDCGACSVRWTVAPCARAWSSGAELGGGDHDDRRHGGRHKLHLPSASSSTALSAASARGRSSRRSASRANNPTEEEVRTGWGNLAAAQINKIIEAVLMPPVEADHGKHTAQPERN